MNNQPPIIEAQPVSDEDRRLLAVFAEIESKQLDFLDQAGKSVIERIAALLAVLFAVTAFGDTFPPPYLQGNDVAKLLVIATMICYMAAMFMGMQAIQPRTYSLYRHNLTRMRQELDKIVDYKSRTVRLAGGLFWLGSATLSLLIGSIILAA